MPSMQRVEPTTPVSPGLSSRDAMPKSLSPFCVSLMPALDDDILIVIRISCVFSYSAASFSMIGVTDDEPETVTRSELPHPPSATSEPKVAAMHIALANIFIVFFISFLLETSDFVYPYNIKEK